MWTVFCTAFIDCSYNVRTLKCYDTCKKEKAMKTRMFRYIGIFGILVSLVLLSLSACSQTGLGIGGPEAVEAAPESAKGGGGVVSVASNNGFTEGIVVVGTGTASADPEVAEVSFGVDLRGDDPAVLVDEGAQKIDRAIAVVQEMGVVSEDIRTVGYNLWVENIYDPETGMPTGEVVYHLSHYIQVELRDLDRVGQFLAAVVDSGVNTVSGVNFTVEDTESLFDQARQEAIADAQSRAAQMAEALGTTLGKPILVTETTGGWWYPPMEGYGGGGMGVSAPTISPGSFSVSISVQVVYAIR
jgi:uncharacterized protein YggE